MRTQKSIPWLFLLIFVGAQFAQSANAQLTDDVVLRSIDSGKRYLLSKQRRDGSWSDEYPRPTGNTLLSTLALLNAGMKADDPAIKKALDYIRKQDLEHTYTVSLQTIVLSLAEPEKDLLKIDKNRMWLQAAQAKGKSGDNAGGWGYDKNSASLRVDPSNTQFALLALYEADRVGVRADDSCWRLALSYWERIQKESGAFSYNPESRPSGSMTCAGIGSLIIASGQVNKLDAKVEGGNVFCCQSAADDDQPLDRALDWLGKNFSVEKNPAPKAKVESDMQHYYYLYALERVGRLAGRRFIGDHDWYREGVEQLLFLQDDLEGYWNDGNRLTCTAFALLFLSKGRRPILLSKIKRLPENDWDRHRHDVGHLTAHVEKRWKQDLTWQVVDISKATVDDLWQSPVLFISGRDALDFAEAEKESLKQYIERGGFVFAENCCKGDGFDRDFRALMKELFPDTSLQLLPKNHAIWVAEQTVNPRYVRTLLGLEACCRTGVVYCPENLSCYWELAKARRAKDEVLPGVVQAEVNACLAIGANVLTYATGRELKQKLDTSDFASVLSSVEGNNEAALRIAKLTHSGGSDEAQSALSNLLAVLGSQTQLPVSTEKWLVSPVDPNLPDYPIAFVHGRRAFRWRSDEREKIREFVENGGVIFADAICADEDFAKSFRAEVKQIFGRSLDRIPPSHEMFTSEFHGHDIRTVALRDPRLRASKAKDPLSVRIENVPPLLEGLEMDGRYVVVFSPNDMSCALENRPSLECRGYTREDAAKIATNIVLYAMQQ